jgi:hypothetical protein
MVAKTKIAKYWHIADAVDSLGIATVHEVKSWITEKYPTEPTADVRENLELLTVNAPSRVHFNKARTDWRSTSGHSQDRLFKIKNEAGRITYQPFDPVRHGHVDLRQGTNGKWIVESIEVGRATLAQDEAKAQAEAFEHLPALDSDDDARIFSFQAVAIRRGQANFRARLLEAYSNRCAVTGCSATPVLEAAHILPYKGEHTDRIDNGLLLRSDIHTLFDLGYLWVAPDYIIRIASCLQVTDYNQFDGRPLRLPGLPEYHPNPAHLSKHA